MGLIGLGFFADFLPKLLILFIQSWTNGTNGTMIIPYICARTHIRTHTRTYARMHTQGKNHGLKKVPFLPLLPLPLYKNQ